MTNLREHVTHPFLLHLTASVISFLTVFSRRHDALTNPQFWAEDGRIWYADAYNRGIVYSLLTPQDGYYQTISRLVACFAQLLPLAQAPLVFNLTAIAVKVLVANFLLSRRMSTLIPSLGGRAAIAFLYLAMPHSSETNANLTNVQWHLALLSFLIIIAAPSSRTLWRIFDFTVVSISALSGPFCLLLLPVAVVHKLMRKEARTFILLVILAVGAMIQMSSLLATARPSAQPLGATIGLFWKIVGGHLFVSAVVGEHGYSWLVGHFIWNVGVAFLVTLTGLGLLVYAFIKAGLELRLLIFFAFLIVSSALLSPAISNEVPQWTVMWYTGACPRYWLIPIFCVFACLLDLTRNSLTTVRRVSTLLLALSVVGIVADWKYPRFKDLEFQRYAASFERVPAGEDITIPINPDWQMHLVKSSDR